MNKEFIKKYFDIYKDYINQLKNVMNQNQIKVRFPNFPEIISENVVKFYIQDFENRNCINSKYGDLEVNNHRIEVKCFASEGPTSFGSTERWKEIYFLDATNVLKDEIIKIYKCNLSNDSDIWKNLQFNKNETFEDKCKKGQRPRIQFNILYKLLENHIQLVFDNSIHILFINKNYLFKENSLEYNKIDMNNHLMDQDNKSQSSEKNISDPKKDNKLRLADFCAGSGAFSFIFHKLNLAKTVFANDVENNCKLFFDENITDCKLSLCDIFDLKNETIPSMDILTAGFPCQPFSLAGKQEGFKDKRSNVFYKLMDIIKFHNPRFVIFENVKNLQSHDNGKTFEIIQTHIKDANYFFKYKILNTCKVTPIPQNRERIFILCFKYEKDYQNFEFPDEILESNLHICNFLEKNVKSKYYYNDKIKIYPKLLQDIHKTIDDNVLYQYRRFYVRENKNNVCPTLTANMGSGGHNVPIIKDKMGIRKLTPKECFYLQGFPNDIKFPSKMSDSALYKISGNAVSLPVIEKLGIQLMKIL
jgi:DNA (cytosine-5)-methyltransferase 1